jgi:hypothetical protein
MMKTKRNAVSAAVVALRTHMNLTQQRFSTEIIKGAVSTVGRWETSDPPKGESLLTLVALAVKAERDDLADIFAGAFLKATGLPRNVVERWAAKREASNG